MKIKLHYWSVCDSQGIHVAVELVISSNGKGCNIDTYDQLDSAHKLYLFYENNFYVTPQSCESIFLLCMHTIRNETLTDSDTDYKRFG